VPQISMLSAVMFDCAWGTCQQGYVSARELRWMVRSGRKIVALTCKKELEVCDKKENGRHWRKGRDCVMFRKNVVHEFVVKLRLSVVSNG
jgi:hypothetical protein